MGALNIYNGLSRGGVVGNTGAAVNAASLAAKNGLFGSSTPMAQQGLGAAGSALGAYEGFKQGGVYGNATGALDTASLAANAGAAAGSSTAASIAPLLGGAATGVGAFAAMYGIGNILNSYFDGPNNNWSIGQINNLLGQVGNGPAGLNAGMALNPNGGINQNNARALTALQQLQDGSFGNANPYVASQLNNMGYQTLNQQVFANGGYIPTAGGGGNYGLGVNLEQE